MKDTTTICKYDGITIGIKNLARHLKLYHNKDYKEYIKENLDDFKQFGWNICPYSGEVIKGKVSRAYLSKFFSDTRAGRIQRPRTEEHSRNLSIAFKKRFAKNPQSHGMLGKHQSNEAKRKIGDKARTRCAQGKHPWIGRHHSEESKRKIGDKARLRYEYGQVHPMLGKHHSVDAVKKIFLHRKMNKLEMAVADELARLGYNFTFQFFITDNGICKSYDFKLKGLPIIVEIDGDFWHGNPETKNHWHKCDEVKANDELKTALAAGRGYRVVRMWERDFKHDAATLGRLIDESRQLLA